jgi:hypothetical protein
MAHTYDELKHKKVAELREIAKGLEHEAVKGYTQLNKDHLLKALCAALGIDAHAHHHAEGIDKAKVKTRIKELKKKRDEILASSDRSGLRPLLREIHGLKHALRRATI